MWPQVTSRAPRASIAEVVADADLDLSLGDERFHAKCCVLDRFYCGRPFHPELVAVETVAEDEVCATCVEIMYEMMCPPGSRATHYHCPFNLLRTCS